MGVTRKDSSIIMGLKTPPDFSPATFLKLAEMTKRDKFYSILLDLRSHLRLFKGVFLSPHSLLCFSYICLHKNGVKGGKADKLKTMRPSTRQLVLQTVLLSTPFQALH